MPHAGDSFVPPTVAMANIAPQQSTAQKVPPSSPESGRPCETDCKDRVGSVRQRRGVAETSAEAFHSLSPRDYLAPKELAILALFTGPEVRLSRQQIAQAVPMLINGVCGRVDSLLSSKRLEECKERRRDPATGKSQKLLQLPRSEQGELVERGGA